MVFRKIMTSTTRPLDEDSLTQNNDPKRIKLETETESTSTEPSTSTSKVDDEAQEKKPVRENYSAHNQGISEQDVGITQYLHPELKGFKGILKQRYTDFLVNEIDKEGNVVYLTSYGFGDSTDPKTSEATEPANAEEEKKQTIDTSSSKTEEAAEEPPKEFKKKEFKLSDENREKLVALLGEATVDGMVALLTNGSKIVTETPIDDKDERTKIHQTVREAFDSKLETRTTPESTFIITLANSNTRVNKNQPRRGKKNRRGKDSKNDAAAALGEKKDYLHFTLYKENKETMQVANIMSKYLRVPPKTVTYAGTKDRRGVTTQRACIYKMPAERVNGLNKALRGIKFGSFKYEDAQLKLGDLQGNEFYITIKNVDEKNPENIAKSMECLRDDGFINYYGMQRFGTFSVSTHTVGSHILKSDWETAVNLILSPQELVIPESVEARKVYHETKDASKALELMPRRCVAESCILQVLAETPRSYFNAIMKIPRNLRIMYGHAYQSYIWNVVASERIKRYGKKIMEGDLVLIDDAEKKANLELLNSATAGEEEEEEIEEDVKQDIFIRARPVTKEEIETGAKTIFDVVLPTPGFDIRYPDNDLKQVYIDEMKKDGLDPDNMRRNIREFSLAGSYRHLLSKPSAVQWWVKRYKNDTDSLVKTDVDLINEGATDFTNRIVEEFKDVVTPETDKEGDEEFNKIAVLLKIQLGTSQYATMALRELMKLDTKRRGDGLDVRTQEK